MIDLDDLRTLEQVDRDGMLAHVKALPEQCRAAWAGVRELELPAHYLGASKIVIAGMGGSAIGGDLAAEVAGPESSIPILVLRDYELPAHVDRHTLVIGSSYSGNTEETLAAFEAAHERGCPLVALATGGRLANLAQEWGAPLISFHYRSQPRAAMGFMLVSLLGVLRAMGAVGDVTAALDEATALMAGRMRELEPGSPQAYNPAKQLAGDIYGRMPVVVGAGPLAPVARRWKSEFNENSKGWSYFEVLPEMNHNAVSGIHFPPGLAERICMLFLTGAATHPRNRLRFDLTQQAFESQGVLCRRVEAPGQTALAQILTAIQLGDYVSVYLAALYGADPTAIDDIVELKRRMSGA
ncbi:MAG: bifunctional phosphoglucose/phosphomannose isomerase [Anaerolineae bacterium]|nr:bifunctional phosphoglucose/phosphomannose isomerase [Anaerolineae bacterium]